MSPARSVWVSACSSVVVLLAFTTVAAADAPLSASSTCETAPVKDGKPTFLFQADYLLWVLQRGRGGLPIAATTDGDPTAGVPTPVRTLYADDRLGSDDPRSGLRLRVGLESCEGIGIDLSGFLLERAVDDFRSDPAALFSPASLVRPFIDSTTGAEALSVVNFGTGIAGSIAVHTQTSLWGAEANLTQRVGLGPLEVVYGGYRYLSLRERLTITDRVTVQLGGLAFFNGNPINEDDTRVRADQFDTHNDFQGAQLGLRAALRRGSFDLSLRSSVALGFTQGTVDAQGVTTLLPAAGVNAQSLAGGMLAASSNIGKRSETAFAVVPEAELSLGCQLTSWARLSVGYNFLYCSAVVRPGDQIDRAINPNQLPSFPGYDAALVADAPRPLFKWTDFWAQGVSVSLSLAF